MYSTNTNVCNDTIISKETQARVANLLSILSSSERSAETARQILCNNYEYDSKQIFNQLDFDGKNLIDASNILSYLKLKGKEITEAEAQLIILFYDSDYDGALNFAEFRNMVEVKNFRPKEYSYIFQYNNNGKLTFNIENAFVKLLEIECDLSKKIIGILSELQSRKDFNVHQIYHLLKGEKTISFTSLKGFFEKNNVKDIFDSDVINILKRLDFDADGKVTLCELNSFLNYPNCVRCNNKNVSCKECGVNSCTDYLCDNECSQEKKFLLKKCYHCPHTSYSPYYHYITKNCPQNFTFGSVNSINNSLSSTNRFTNSTLTDYPHHIYYCVFCKRLPCVCYNQHKSPKCHSLCHYTYDNNYNELQETKENNIALANN